MRRWAEAGPTTRDQSGFTLLELVVVIVLVILLFLTAWWRLLPLRGDAEAAHVATTIGTLRSALGLEVTERIVNGSIEKAADLEAANPMTLLGQAPSNYFGEVDASSEPGIEPGSWYFDENSGRLHYRVRFPQYLAAPPEHDRVDLSWQVKLSYRDTNENDTFDPAVDSLRGIRLEELDNPKWPKREEILTDPQE